MEVFSITLTSSSEDKMSRLTRCLSDAFADLHSLVSNSGVWDVDSDSGRLRYVDRHAGSNEGEHRAAVLRHAATGMAEYVLLESETALLRSIARKQFRYDRDEDLDKIVWHCGQFLYGSGATEETGHNADSRSRRKRKVAKELEAFLKQQPRIHLDGYVTFRLASYREELREVVEYAVDEYVMDKQYQEFISLLKYFVCLQETKVSVVHLIHVQDSQFSLYDERYEPVQSRAVDRVVAEMVEAEINFEDMVVSHLISIAPERIVIHTRQEELPVIRTIEAIFDRRVTVCAGCRSCGTFFEGAFKPGDRRST
ncbi:sporulation protein [Paenibacillus darwinianus]|uniref:Sporulation protein n=1 Tax=Paenibacillus darwinianus TaxID=1380763 RepID=A0A9W5S1Y0_9BACL|nr:putative sporulation protein YtxC [Paenibacillus darwinianus]EXX89557.1 sporulation protein [Paenibacillus darwinianus]EXX91133.1 sporulation protein [Paenibacillus darwinianus]